jgi:serine O-acetyltransferase
MQSLSSHPNKTKATLKSLVGRMKLLVSLPALLPYAFTTERRLIAMDTHRWLAILDRTKKTQVSGLLYLLANFPEFRTVYYYRIKKGNIIPLVFVPFLKWVYKERTNLFIHCDHVGAGLYIQHGFDTIIAAERIGDNCWINQQVTIGHTVSGHQPTIGNNVTITAGAKILGKITLGDNVIVGANAVVIKSVPANCTVVGVPATIVKRDGVRVREAL